jgi:hypothetical protein
MPVFPVYLSARVSIGVPHLKPRDSAGLIRQTYVDECLVEIVKELVGPVGHPISGCEEVTVEALAFLPVRDGAIADINKALEALFGIEIRNRVLHSCVDSLVKCCFVAVTAGGCLVFGRGQFFILF